jgi:WXXGXW repeat (2 copies)
MMNRINVLGSLVVALLALPSVGCVVRGSGYVSGPTVAVVEVEEEPPPPRVVHYDYRPGFIWIEGRWNWRGGRWVWMDGRYERERVGYVYAPGRWERRGRRHVWVEGRWNAGAAGRVERREDVRDHRDRRRDHDDGRGPVIRDHRR